MLRTQQGSSYPRDKAYRQLTALHYSHQQHTGLDRVLRVSKLTQPGKQYKPQLRQPNRNHPDILLVPTHLRCRKSLRDTECRLIYLRWNRFLPGKVLVLQSRQGNNNLHRISCKSQLMLRSRSQQRISLVLWTQQHRNAPLYKVHIVFFQGHCSCQPDK